MARTSCARSNSIAIAIAIATPDSDSDADTGRTSHPLQPHQPPRPLAASSLPLPLPRRSRGSSLLRLCAKACLSLLRLCAKALPFAFAALRKSMPFAFACFMQKRYILRRGAKRRQRRIAKALYPAQGREALRSAGCRGSPSSLLRLCAKALPFAFSFLRKSVDPARGREAPRSAGYAGYNGRPTNESRRCGHGRNLYRPGHGVGRGPAPRAQGALHAVRPPPGCVGRAGPHSTPTAPAPWCMAPPWPPTPCWNVAAPRVALVTTEGFRDVLEIGRGDRSALYDLSLPRVPPLVPAPPPAGSPRTHPGRWYRGKPASPPPRSAGSGTQWHARVPRPWPCAFSTRTPGPSTRPGWARPLESLKHPDQPEPRTRGRVSRVRTYEYRGAQRVRAAPHEPLRPGAPRWAGVARAPGDAIRGRHGPSPTAWRPNLCAPCSPDRWAV